MGEIVSFRIARTPQRLVDIKNMQLPLPVTEEVSGWLDQPQNAKSRAQEYLISRRLVPPATKFGMSSEGTNAVLESIRWLDELLMAHDNRVAWSAIAAAVHHHLEGAPADVIVRLSWTTLKEDLTDALVATLVAPGGGAIGADILRLLVVMGLLETAATNPDMAPDAVFGSLRWRTVALPPGIELLPFIRKSILARRPGVADFYTVQEEWTRYDLGEIAHIENVFVKSRPTVTPRQKHAKRREIRKSSDSRGHNWTRKLTPVLPTSRR